MSIVNRFLRVQKNKNTFTSTVKIIRLHVLEVEDIMFLDTAGDCVSINISL
jgi:hypothetical protein